jgi:predicted DNA-binding transcriptional regulator YafY
MEQKEIKEKMLAQEKTTHVLAEILLAIETNNSIEFEYHKEILNSSKRKVNPHNLYWNKDNTKVMLDGFQISGDSKSNQLESFKQFDTNFIKSALILDETFSINEKYNSKSDRYNNSILGVIV